MKRKVISKSYKGLSEKEVNLITSLTEVDRNPFEPLDVEKALGCTPQSAYTTISRLKKKGWIDEIEKGKYLLKGIVAEHVDPFELATRMVWPSYISFWSALNFYKLTEQVPFTIFVVTTKHKRQMKLSSMRLRFVSLSPKRFFGYRRVGKITIAEVEKALLDSLLYPRYAGGLGEIAKSLREADLDPDRLVDYALRLDSKSLCARLGYLLDYVDKPLDSSHESALLNRVGDSYPKLDVSKPRKGHIDKKWRVLVNVEVKE